MTGAKADIEALQKSFDAYQDNKMDHEPSTLVWPGDGATWLRLDGFPTADETVEADWQVGARIYVEGRLLDGSPLRAQVLGREITGSRAPCTTCHRPSGHSVSEGELDVPRVTGPVLFAPLDERRVDNLPPLYETPLSKTALACARASSSACR